MILPKFNKLIEILLLFILIGTSVFAQKHSNDTIFIYEEVTVYDTVYISEKIERIHLDALKRIEAIAVFSISENEYPKILKKKSFEIATFNKNSIIQLKNKKSMKKLFLLGAVFISLQNLFAQTELELTAGGGTWFQSGNIDYAEKPISPLLHTGFYIKKYFRNENLALKTGFIYGCLFHSGTYSYSATNSVFAEKMEVYDLNQYYGLNYSYYSVPLLLYYNKSRIKPFLGVNYNNIASSEFRISFDPDKRRNISLNLGLNCGLEYRFKSINAAINFTHNLTNDYSANYYNGPLDRKNLYLRNNQISFSISYVLIRKNPVVKTENSNI